MSHLLELRHHRKAGAESDAGRHPRAGRERLLNNSGVVNEFSLRFTEAGSECVKVNWPQLGGLKWLQALFVNVCGSGELGVPLSLIRRIASR